MRNGTEGTVFWLLAGALGLAVCAPLAAGREARQAPPTYAVVVQSGRAGCRVDVDENPLGRTNQQGTLNLENIVPGDHYFHVRCPGEEERSYFVSLQGGQPYVLESPAASPAAAPAASSPLDAAERRHQLQNLLLKAVGLRAHGNFDEAVELLRDATRLDPANADLHRELGITFLLNKDWERARIEMQEAIHHDPRDADAHNGLGYALEKLGDLAAAVKEYRQATRLDPDDPSYRQHYLDAQTKLAYQEYLKKKL